MDVLMSLAVVVMAYIVGYAILSWLIGRLLARMKHGGIDQQYRQRFRQG